MWPKWSRKHELRLREFPAQIVDLADVMVQVDGAAEKDGEAILGLGFVLGGVGESPVGVGLAFDGGDDHGDGFIEFAKDGGLRRPVRFGEFEVAVADIAGFGDTCADVIAEIAGEMENQVAHAVAVDVGIAPELILGERINPLVKFGGAHAVFARERRGNGFGKFIHLGPRAEGTAKRGFSGQKAPLRMTLPSVRSLSVSGNRFFVLEDDALFHHKKSVFGLANVLGRITGHGDDIREFAGFEGTDFIGEAEERRVGAGTRL